MAGLGTSLAGRVTALAIVVAIVAHGDGAAANGAFPDAEAVLVPPDRPHQILLATNFGLVRSEDDGATWTWACEQGANGVRDLYQLGPPPRRRLFAREAGPLVMTDDGGCTWSSSGGASAGAYVTDAFPDPSDDDRVVAVVATPTVTDGSYTVGYALYESSDGGATLDGLLYAAPAGAKINSVEISRSDPRVIQMIVVHGTANAPRLVRTTNRGASWTETDLSPALGGGNVLIIAIDPADPARVFLRVNPGGREQLVIADGAGATLRTPLTLAGGFLTGFARPSAATIVISGMVGGDAVMYRSRDGGETFEPVPGAPRLRGLAQRGGTLFAAGALGEAFDVGVSTDDGTTWRPLMRYQEVRAIDTCLHDACQDLCQDRVAQGIFPQQVCSAPAPPGTGYGDDPDSGADAGAAPGGASDAGGASDPGGAEAPAADGADDSSAAGTDGTLPPDAPATEAHGGSGCGCATSRADARSPLGWLLLAGAWRLRRRPRSTRRGAPAPARAPSLPGLGLAGRPARRFVLRFAVMAAVLLGLYYAPPISGSQSGWLDTYLHCYATVAGAFLRLFEPNIAVIGKDIAGRYALTVAKTCDAMDVSILFVSAVVAWPSGWRRRLTAAAIGISTLFVVNVLRICSLYFVGVRWPSSFNLVHLELWPLVILLVAVALFLGFTRWTGGKPIPAPTPEPQP